MHAFICAFYSFRHNPTPTPTTALDLSLPKFCMFSFPFSQGRRWASGNEKGNREKNFLGSCHYFGNPEAWTSVNTAQRAAREKEDQPCRHVGQCIELCRRAIGVLFITVFAPQYQVRQGSIRTAPYGLQDGVWWIGLACLWRNIGPSCFCFWCSDSFPLVSCLCTTTYLCEK